MKSLRIAFSSKTKTQKNKSAKRSPTPKLVDSNKVIMTDLTEGKQYHIQYVKGKNGLIGMEFSHPNKNKLEIGTFSKTEAGVPYFRNIRLTSEKKTLTREIKSLLRDKKNWYFQHPGNENGLEARLNNDFDFYEVTK
jgi:hypothetical protein